MNVPRKWLRPLLVGVLLIAAGGIAVRLTESRPFCQQALIPAYFYPGTNWTRAIASKPPPRLMIVDITTSGPGSAPDRNYQMTTRHARAAGITLVGYVNTDYAARPVAAVETDVSHYKSWYGVTDIFLDGVSSDGGDLAYYRQLAGYVHQANPGSLVILNPGTYPDQRYMSVGDIVLVFENSYSQYLRLRVPRWADSYPAARFAYIVYGAPSSQLASVISMSRQRNAGNVYVTSGTGTNPYSSLPGYWTTEDSILAACAGLLTGRDCAARRGPG